MSLTVACFRVFTVIDRLHKVKGQRGVSGPGFKLIKLRKKVKIRNQCNQVPDLNQDTIWESDKNTRKHHIPESQKVSPFLEGDHKAARNRQPYSAMASPRTHDYTSLLLIPFLPVTTFVAFFLKCLCT